MRIIRDEHYQRQERKFFRKHVNLLDKYKEVLNKLKVNPFDSTLKMHKLTGKLKEFYACNLTYEYRIICTFIIHSEFIVLVDIGSHDDIY